MTIPDSTAPVVVPVIWGNVPPRNKNFTGRMDILAQLQGSETRKVTAVLPSEPLPRAVQGLGGVGKTAVVIEFAHRYRSDYELVWWVPSDQPALVRSSLAALAQRLGLEAAAATGIESAVQAVREALRRGEPYRRWLLIFDNADQPEDLMDYIPDGPGDVLITSRNHRWLSYYDTVQLNVFTRAESRQFLTRRVLQGLSDSDVDRLAEELGDLPLALEQAGAVLAEAGMPVEEYLRLLEEHVKQIMALGKPAEYPEPMTAAWELSVLALREQVPQALELLRCCAFFGPDPIPRDVFRWGAQAGGTQISELMANPILLAQALRELGRFALVKLEGRTIAVHRLIQALLRDDLPVDEQRKYQHEVHTILAAAAPGDPTDSRLWPRYAELLAHVASIATDLPRCPDESVRAFARDVIRYLNYSGDFASSLSFGERFINQWTEDSGPDDPNVLDARRLYANALRGLGRYQEAFEIVSDILDRARAALGRRDPLTLSLENSLGAAYRARGDFGDALVLDGSISEVHEELFGATDPRTLRVLNSLAIDYRLNSRFTESRDLHQRVYLAQSASGSGVTLGEVLQSWSGLAEAVRLCGNYSEARDVGEEALDFGRDRLGPEHFVTLQTATTLAIALRRVGTAYDESLELANQVYVLSEQLLGENHPDTMAAAIALTNIQRTIGETKTAISLADVTVARYPNVYGPQHPFYYGCVSNLALLRRVNGDAEGARKLNETALAGLDERLTRDHQYSLVVAINLASDLAELGEVAAARALNEGTLRRLRALLGENHPVTLGCAANLTIDLRADGAVAAADTLLAETMTSYTEVLGSEHPDVQVTLAGRRLDFDFDPSPI